LTADTKDMSKDLLRNVSRSFYLSMKTLPLDMREPVSLGYLLARSSDTIADTASVSQELRLDLLGKIRKQIFEKGEGLDDYSDQLKSEFCPHQSHDGEKQLLNQLPDCFEWLNQMDRANQFSVIKVLGHITNGQLWDVEKFGSKDKENPAFVETAEELEQYTYRVAGSVGEFWTEVGYSNGGRDFSNEGTKEMKEFGRLYGQGLQLVNVIRDIGEDLANGRCYLPKDELIQQGWNEEEGRPPDELLLKVINKWREQCREWLQAGQQYVGRVKSKRVRYATILPLLIAKKTVDLIEKAGPDILQKKVKVSRGGVRKIMARALFC